MNCTVCNVWLTTDSVSSLVCSLFFLYFSSFYLFFLFFTTCTHANIVDPANSHCCYDQNIALLVEHRVKITCYHVIFAMLLLVFFLLSYCLLLFFFLFFSTTSISFFCVRLRHLVDTTKITREFVRTNYDTVVKLDLSDCKRFKWS